MAAPVLFFSDLTSGPKNGNSDSTYSTNGGCYVTIWGCNLGSSQGTSMVTCCGAAGVVVSWGNATAPADLYTMHRMQMIVFQVASTATDGAGTISVTVGGVTSNTLAFTVRSGNIYYVKITGSDSAAGSWSAPWLTIPKAAHTIADGDIAYVCDGVSATGQDPYDTDASALVLHGVATAASPRTIASYPGADITVGSTSIDRGIYCKKDPSSDRNTDHVAYWTISKFTSIGTLNAMAIRGDGVRAIGNYISAPVVQNAQSGCFMVHYGSDLIVEGNEIADCGATTAPTTCMQHTVYISGKRSGVSPRFREDTNRVIAWNYLHDNHCNRGLNIYTEGSAGLEYSGWVVGVKVHDNVVVNQRGIGILIGLMQVGSVDVYNNIVKNAGLGPDFSDNTVQPSAISVLGGFHSYFSETGLTTTIRIWNNTLIGTTDDLGAANYPCVLHIASNVINSDDPMYPEHIDVRNNLIVNNDSTSYYVGRYKVRVDTVEGGNNLWYSLYAAPWWYATEQGMPSPPAFDDYAVTGEPLFVDAANDDYTPTASSPAVGSGDDTTSVCPRDFFGNLRSADAVSIGAIEYAEEETPMGGWYTHALELVGKGDINLDTDTLKVMLVDSTYSYDPDSEHVTDIVAHELSVTGYEGGFNGSGRHALSNTTIAQDDTNNRVTFDADDPATWTSLSSGATIGGAVIIKEGTSESDSHPIFFVDFVNTATGGDFALHFDECIARLNHAA